NIISYIVREPYTLGTWFISKGTLSARERWIAFGTRPKGKIIVDDGAKKALVNKKSLLAVGVVGLEGAFEVGDIVSVLDLERQEIGRGKVGVSNRILDKVKGTRFAKEVIHRDNIVILKKDT
ncbi:MAG: glutamate 5-kinase, partial [Candidatus Omnitrophica bacterium]|nr:glutamate 5-kinase [Candidatus Omnitrophota bacterium]